MGKRISRGVELLEQDQAIYYDGPQLPALLGRNASRDRELNSVVITRAGA